MAGSYHEAERVLCYHGPLIYEAKINKAENWTDPKKHHGQTGPHFYVHYKGWKQTWDEWVPETRLLKWNEENISRQKQLNEAQRAKDRAEREAMKAGNLDTSISAKSAAQTTKASHAALASGVGARGTKRNRDAVAEEEEFKNKPEIKIVIPDMLKVKLVDDWEAITKDSKLVPLPRTPSVATILAEYEASVASTIKPTRSLALTHEVVSGLKLYFDKSLGNNLLYRFERNQYAEIKKKYATLSVGQPIPVEIGDGKDSGDKKLREMSDIYGVEHLLRLFVNLPELIAHTTMDAETVTVLRDALHDILKWINQERDRLFVGQYEETSSAYQNVSRT